MMTAKEQIIKAVASLPDTLSADEIIDNILYLNKIYRGVSKYSSPASQSCLMDGRLK
jgi:hypothetical protein